jgi:2'-5' RNA ligase
MTGTVDFDRPSTRQLPAAGQSHVGSFVVLNCRMAKRLFLALELPDALTRALAALDPHIPGLRWLPTRALHLTLAFLGDVETEKMEELVRSLSGMEVNPFDLSLRGLGRFGRRGRPAIVVVEIDQPPPALFALWTEVQKAVGSAGLPTDSRPFHPHVTLGRGKQCPEALLKDFLNRNTDTEFGTFRVDGLSLFSSELTPQGAHYTLESRKDF